MRRSTYLPTPTSFAKPCDRCRTMIVVSKTEKGWEVRTALPNGNGGWKGGGLHWKDCAARKKPTCAFCRLRDVKSIGEIAELGDEYLEPRFCVQHASMKVVYIPALKRSVETTLESFRMVRWDAKKWVRKHQRLAKKAEGTAKISEFGPPSGAADHDGQPAGANGSSPTGTLLAPYAPDS